MSYTYFCLVELVPYLFTATDSGPRMLLSENGTTLVITNVCKTCKNGQTDLMVIQCNASNVHGYAFAQGYLNVLCKYTHGSDQIPL